jgi:hypothetical protein
MQLFSIALVPEGNIIAQVRAVRRAAFAAGDSPAGSALPDGIYLGFYAAAEAGPAAMANEKALVRSFRRNARSLFKGLPETLTCSACARAGGRWYIEPEPALTPALAAAADTLASEAGFIRAEIQPVSALAGFFAANDVTPPAFGAFSFRHLDAALYRMECGDANFEALWWRCLERAPRHVGPRKKASVRSSDGRSAVESVAPAPPTPRAGPVVIGGDSML